MLNEQSMFCQYCRTLINGIRRGCPLSENYHYIIGWCIRKCLFYRRVLHSLIYPSLPSLAYFSLPTFPYLSPTLSPPSSTSPSLPSPTSPLPPPTSPLPRLLLSLPTFPYPLPYLSPPSSTSPSLPSPTSPLPHLFFPPCLPPTSPLPRLLLSLPASPYLSPPSSIFPSLPPPTSPLPLPYPLPTIYSYITQCRNFLAEQCISSEVFVSECLPSLLALVSDKVPNIRLALARAVRETLANRGTFWCSLLPLYPSFSPVSSISLLLPLFLPPFLLSCVLRFLYPLLPSPPPLPSSSLLPLPLPLVIQPVHTHIHTITHPHTLQTISRQTYSRQSTS